MKNTFTTISIVIMIFGITSFIYNFFLQDNSITNGERPLCKIEGIIEQNGFIYIGLGEYNRIQVYNLKGEYINYIETNTFSKDFNFTINKDTNEPIIDKILSKELVPKFKQENGDIFFISSLFPIVISKQNKNGVNEVIRQNLFMSFWAGKFRSWLVGAFGAVLLLIINLKFFIKSTKNRGREDQSLIYQLKKLYN